MKPRKAGAGLSVTLTPEQFARIERDLLRLLDSGTGHLAAIRPEYRTLAEDAAEVLDSAWEAAFERLASVTSVSGDGDRNVTGDREMNVAASKKEERVASKV